MNPSHERFIPMSRPEMDRLGWDVLDVLLVSGDAYVDHPAFGTALLARLLESHGYRVGIVAQPRWDGLEDVTRLGRPRLFAGVGAGALDSMLAHYTAFRKKRKEDAYSPGGRAGLRPNRACIVYANLVKRAFPGLPVVLGGIEASLRRVSHYDFWSDRVRRSILLDSKADLLIYGMAERAVVETADRLADAAAEGRTDETVLRGIPGTVFAGSVEDVPEGAPLVELPSHEDILRLPEKLMEATPAMEMQVHGRVSWAFQRSGDRTVMVAPPAEPLSTEEMDQLYALPFQRLPHPDYREPIPAAAMIQSSITSHRGCGGGCSFCSLALHQGRRVQSRSRESILSEVKRMSASPEFKGGISDVGGPTANLWAARCVEEGPCKRRSCLYPRVCPKLAVDLEAGVELLRAVAGVPGVKHVRVASGLRFDLALRNPPALRGFIHEFVGGQLKLAPEHVVDSILDLMRKPGVALFEKFLDLFYEESKRAGKEQYVVPYFMSAFPGCREEDMKELGHWLSRRNWRPRQVQCFIPTPGTVASAMYYAEIDPKGHPIHVAKSDAERLRQHHILLPKESSSTEERTSDKERTSSRGKSHFRKETSARTGAPAQKKTSSGERTLRTAGPVRAVQGRTKSRSESSRTPRRRGGGGGRTK